jgi:SRSO17 transposase
MVRTPLVAVDAEVLERLDAYAAQFARDFGRIDRTRWSRTYLEGLLLDGERKSIEPLSRRVVVPGWRGDTEQALQQFINQSPWDHAAVLQRYRALLAAAFADPAGVLLIDDTSFPKKGLSSVGVARQDCGAAGKRENCQVAVSLHYAASGGDYPLALRLYLPETWTSAPARLDAARVPEGERAFRAKWRLALDLLDQVRAEGLPHRAVVADAGYGEVGAFRRALEARGETYVVGLNGEEVVYTEPPAWAMKPRQARGRCPRRWYPAAGTPRPVAVQVLAQTLARAPVTWRAGAKGPLTAEFAWLRVWPGYGWQAGREADDGPAPEPRWLLVEWRADGTIKYALSNLPRETPLADAVGLWKSRWQVERGYQQLKDELGLDHFEGRSWAGFHHHAALTFLAYGFLALERARDTAPTLDADEEVLAEPPPLQHRRLARPAAAPSA